MNLNTFFLRKREFLAEIVCLALVFILAPTGMGEEALSAKDLAARLSGTVEDGESGTRLRLKIKPTKGEGETVVQVQVKARRSAAKTEIMYQVLWPKESKGQAFLVQREGKGTAKGVAYTPPKTLDQLAGGKMMNPVFGSDLAYQDVVENFFKWEQQQLDGKEAVERTECVILESKPGSGDPTPYGKVRSWIDPQKLVVMKVEKYDTSGKLVRSIETTRVYKDERKLYIPASLLVRRSGSGTVTEIEGSNIRRDVEFKDEDFTTKALNDFRLPR
jgi:hypothetical protein